MWRDRPGLAPSDYVLLDKRAETVGYETETVSPTGSPRAAVWRRRQGDPHTAWGWTFRHNIRLELVRDRFKGSRGLALGLLLTVVPSGLLLAHKPGLVAAFLGPLGGNFVLKRRHYAQAHGTLPTFLEAPEASDTLPVTMTVSVDGKRTAREIGWLSLTDGWLVFEGLRATVALKPDSSKHIVEKHRGSQFRIADGRDVEFTLLTDASETTLPASASRRREVAAMIRRWQKGFCPEGESVFPPGTVHPEVEGDRVGQAFLWFAVFAPVALFVGFLSSAAGGLAFGVVALASLGLFAARLVAFRRALPTLVQDPFGTA